LTISKSSDVYDAIIIGAGFSGLQQLHFLRDKLGLKTLVIEEAYDLGGTWFWNRYPGARCDSQSYSYCYYFSKELLKAWKWEEKYPSQKEILKYLNFVADKLALRSSILFNNKVISVSYNLKNNKYCVVTNKVKIRSQYVISAVGCLSSTNIPDIPNLKDFNGEIYHTGSWPHSDVEFEGKRVGVIGTGSSGIQAIPIIAKKASEVLVFQRTPNFSIPARNENLSDGFFNKFCQNIDNYKALMKESRHGHPWLTPETSIIKTEKKGREEIFEEAWKAGGLRFRECFGDTLTNLDSNELISEFIKSKIRSLVKNQETARVLTKFDYPFGTKRPALDTDYFETFNNSHVHLIDLEKSPIKKFISKGLETSFGKYDLDVIVFATGFDALTGSILKIDFKGKDNVRLIDTWKEGAKTYLGLQVNNFPNLFFITGPGSPSVLTNMPQSIDQNVTWITDCIKFMKKNKYSIIEASQLAVDQWTDHVQNTVEKTLFVKANHSWYYGSNIPGKPRLFLPYSGGLKKYRMICNKVAKDNYNGFILN